LGELITKDSIVEDFNEKPQVHQGGLSTVAILFFNKKFLQVPFSKTIACILERQPLEDLVKDRELCVYEHRGILAMHGHFRDLEYLNGLWRDGKAEWKQW